MTEKYDEDDANDDVSIDDGGVSDGHTTLSPHLGAEDELFLENKDNNDADSNDDSDGVDDGDVVGVMETVDDGTERELRKEAVAIYELGNDWDETEQRVKSVVGED